MSSVKKLYVGNLHFQCKDDHLRELFAQYGEVISAKVITDRETGRSKGFAFVEMPETQANAAIEALNGYSFEGRAITVNEARPQGERPTGGGGHRDRGGYDRSSSRGYNRN